MSIDTRKLSELATWILALCAICTTILVVRREFSPEQQQVAGESQTQPVFFEQWRDALAAGIRLGPADAPVQVVEFADFQCPYCARFELTVKTVREKYPDQVAFTFAHMPLPQHGFAESAARAAECADSQGRFEAMRVALHVNPDKMPSPGWETFSA